MKFSDKPRIRRSLGIGPAEYLSPENRREGKYVYTEALFPNESSEFIATYLKRKNLNPEDFIVRDGKALAIEFGSDSEHSQVGANLAKALKAIGEERSSAEPSPGR